MEGVKSLECGPEELPGVWGVERSEGGGGNWEGPRRPGGPAEKAGESRPITGDPGKWARAGRASEAAVVPLEPAGQHNRRRGKGRCVANTRSTWGRAGECRSWLGPPGRTTSENCNERSSGRPRPIPGDGSTRFMTRSSARDVLER